MRAAAQPPAPAARALPALHHGAAGETRGASGCRTTAGAYRLPGLPTVQCPCTHHAARVLLSSCRPSLFQPPPSACRLGRRWGRCAARGRACASLCRSSSSTPPGGPSPTRWRGWRAPAWRRMCTTPPSQQTCCSGGQGGRGGGGVVWEARLPGVCEFACGICWDSCSAVAHTSSHAVAWTHVVLHPENCD